MRSRFSFNPLFIETKQQWVIERIKGILFQSSFHRDYASSPAADRRGGDLSILFSSRRRGDLPEGGSIHIRGLSILFSSRREVMLDELPEYGVDFQSSFHRDAKYEHKPSRHDLPLSILFSSRLGQGMSYIWNPFKAFNPLFIET